MKIRSHSGARPPWGTGRTKGLPGFDPLTRSLAFALEMERHLRGLLYMWRLALPGSPAIAGEMVT
jgi:hypothetical protein